MTKIVALSLRHSLWAGIFFCFPLAYESLAMAEEASPSQKLTTRFQHAFAGKEFEVKDYDEQLKEVIVNSEHFFSSHDGRYVFAGPIYDTDQQVDIVSERAALFRQALLSAQPKELFVRYPSTVEQKYQLTVVTDIDCPYCRKLHNSLGELNTQGVSVNYVMLPRAGVKSKSYSKTRNALCSDDPAASITRAMASLDLPESNGACDASQLRQQMELAGQMKIRSTPTFILPNGKLQVGLLSAANLVALLDGTNVQGARYPQ